MNPIYLQNKYTAWYYNIINLAKNRINQGYTENHHIIPRCLGGQDTEDNLVHLTAREHYICHLLLTKMVEGNAKYKTIYAYLIMSARKSPFVQREYKINSRLYESLKKQQKHSEETKKKLSKINTGRKHTEEVKKKMSDGHKGQKAWNKGKIMPPISEETRKKISEAIKGHDRPHRPETKEKIRQTLKKKYESQPHHSKGREPWNKGRKRTGVKPVNPCADNEWSLR